MQGPPFTETGKGSDNSARLQRSPLAEIYRDGSQLRGPEPRRCSDSADVEETHGKESGKRTSLKQTPQQDGHDD